MIVRTRTEHAELRAEERYGITATDAQWSQALLDILDSVAGCRQAAMLLKTDKRQGSERWLVHLAGVQVVACYLPAAALIVSVWPHGLHQDLRHIRRNGWGRTRREREREEVWE